MKNRSIKLLISLFMIISLVIVFVTVQARFRAEQEAPNGQNTSQTTEQMIDNAKVTDDNAQQETEPVETDPTTSEIKVPLPISINNPPPIMPEIGTGLRRWPEVLSIPHIREPDLGIYLNADKNSLPLQGITVILDPGHGGQDGGAQFPIGVAQPDYLEKEIVLEVSFKIRNNLEALGAEDVMLREDDVWLSIYTRIAKTSQYILNDFMELLPYHGYEPDNLEYIMPQLQEMIDINSDFASSGGRGPMLGVGTIYDMRLLMDVQAQYPDVLFISVHCNALEDLSVGGLQVFYQTAESAYQAEHETVMYQPVTENPPAYSLYPDEGRMRLAELVRDQILEEIPELKFPGENDLLEANFAVLREMGMTSILLEMGFITNERDRAILTSQNEQEKIARGVADAVYQYYTKP